MDFFNIGGLELVFLLALTVMLVGPQKAVELTNQIARFVASMRRTVNSVKDDLQSQLDEETADLKQIEQDVRSVVGAETQVFRDARNVLREAEDEADNSLKAAKESDGSDRARTSAEERAD
jgi:Sec-independent protein translocase protein TatA